VAAGKAGLIKAEHVNEHAVVIDIGINPLTGPDGKVRMVGDVEFASVAPRVRAITPVTGASARSPTSGCCTTPCGRQRCSRARTRSARPRTHPVRRRRE
jgi:hypothetical protein